KCYWVSFQRDALIAVSRWITTGATGAFSAFGENVLTLEVMKKAGLTWSDGNAVPIEFRETPLVDVLERIDFESIVDRRRDTSRILEQHQQLAEGSHVTNGGSYFIGDIDSNFTFHLTGSEVSMTGEPLKYSWRKTNGVFVKVHGVAALVSESQVDQILSDR